IHQEVKANWLASPPLVVAFALAGTTRVDLSKEPLGHDADGKPVYLSEIWPTSQEIADAVRMVDGAMFSKEYSEVFSGDEHWQAIPVGDGKTYDWRDDSTYVKNPPYFVDIEKPIAALGDVVGARVLAIFGDSITTDHISTDIGRASCRERVDNSIHSL